MGIPPKTKSKSNKVKIISPFADRWFLHQIPLDMRWGNCTFTLDRLDNNYDWLVAYNNIPCTPENLTKGITRNSTAIECIQCLPLVSLHQSPITAEHLQSNSDAY